MCKCVWCFSFPRHFFPRQCFETVEKMAKVGASTTPPRIVATSTSVVDEQERNDLIQSLRETCMFSRLSDNELNQLSLLMERIDFKQGEVIGNKQGQPTVAMFVITKGQVERCRSGLSGDKATISSNNEFPLREVIGEERHLVSFGVLHSMTARPVYATTTALSDGVAWRLPAKVLMEHFKNPEFGQGVAAGLSSEILRMSEVYVQQHFPRPLEKEKRKRN
jgi:CRP-like cAMP-binding protein